MRNCFIITFVLLVGPVRQAAAGDKLLVPVWERAAFYAELARPPYRNYIEHLIYNLNCIPTAVSHVQDEPVIVLVYAFDYNSTVSCIDISR